MTESAIGRYRWTIVGLLFAATTINYIDRQVIGFEAYADDCIRLG
jgi:ACS family hexuronate transporter-like MFS transporter